MPAGPIYHLEITVGGCALLALLNGFPVVSRVGEDVAIEAPPVNPFLVGQGNTLVMEVSASPGSSADSADLSGVTLVVKVKAYEPGDIVAPESGEAIAAYDLAEAPPESRTGLPLTATLTFETEGPSFRPLLLEGPVLESADAVRDYALRLRDLVRAKSVRELQAEFAPKLRDYVTAYSLGDVDAAGAFAEFLTAEFIPAGPVLDFDRSDLGIKLWCGGRIAEVTLGEGELLAARADSEGSRYTLPVYVGRVDGQLRVVR
jgi:hypothetical protein